MARSGFKMKYSPAKGRLDNFFSSLGKQLKRNKKDIGGELKKKYKGSKQTTNRAGKKIGYEKPKTTIEGVDGATYTSYSGGGGEKHNTQERRSKQVAKGNVTTAADQVGMRKVEAKKFVKEVTKPAATTTKKTNTKKTTKKKVSYATAYKNADKKKYPTLASFTKAAKAYNAKKKK